MIVAELLEVLARLPEDAAVYVSGQDPILAWRESTGIAFQEVDAEAMPLPGYPSVDLMAVL